MVGQLLTNAAYSGVCLYVSHHNYPGGRGLQELHRLLPATAGLSAEASSAVVLANVTNHDSSAIPDVSVHIDTYAAETGVSRFLEQNKNWRSARFLSSWLEVTTPRLTCMSLLTDMINVRTSAPRARR